jgi:predicted unusual protein kinase regulating ubiquinone biosynthesis (AarF/ABC1/UbiB family)
MARKPRRRPTTQTGRFLRLTGMTASLATRVAGQRMRGTFQSDDDRRQSRDQLMREVGQEVAATLGEMKGAVMKVGQVASQMQDILPEEVSDALSVLQKASTPMPFSVIRKQLRQELGDEPENLFAEFDEEPFAAASIGQVHRAQLPDGTEVAIKVQYPAVKESIDSDMGHLRRILRLGGLLKVDAPTLDAIFDEIRQQLAEELDYEQEASHLTEFRRFHRDLPWLIIPEVVESRSTDKVLTLTYETGDDLDTIATSERYDQATRNLLGERLFRVISDQIFCHHAVHGDPHPGNFAFRPDGSLIIYDFGAIKRIPDEDTEIFRRLVRAALDRDFERLDTELRELGIRKTGGPEVEPEFYAGWVNLLTPMFGDEPFDFANSRVHIHLAKKTRDTPWRYLDSFRPSHRTLLIDRVLGGHYWTLKKLGVVTSFRNQLEPYLQDRSRDPANA